jgi:hypothetical protein
MRMPQGLDHKPGLQLAIGLLFAAGLVVTMVGRCNRLMQPRPETPAPPAEIVDVGTVSVGAIVQGTLDINGREAWTLVGSEGDRIAVALFSAWDNSVSIVRPDSGWELIEDGFSGGNGQGLIDGVTLPVDGIYRIVVSGENGGAGNYELTVNKAPPRSPGTITTVGPGDAPIVMTQ